VEVTQAWEVAAVVEVTRVVMELATGTSAQEAAVARDSATIHIKDVEDWATLAEREARERVSRVEAENAAVLPSAREDAEGLVRKITHLEGELAEVSQAREVAEENSCGLSDVAVDAKHWWEVS
jgi:uncharacterized protein with gpF-like domain